MEEEEEEEDTEDVRPQDCDDNVYNTVRISFLELRFAGNPTTKQEIRTRRSQGRNQESYRSDDNVFRKAKPFRLLKGKSKH